MPAGDLTTVANVKEHLTLGKTTTTDSGLIQALLSACSASWLSRLDRALFAATYDEVRDGTGTNTILFTEYPVSAVTSIEVGCLPAPRRALVENTEFVWTPAKVQLLGGARFPRGVATVRLVYVAGYATIPQDLADACAETVALRYKQLQQIGQTSKTLNGETTNFDKVDLTKYATAVFNNYSRRIPLASIR